MTKVKPINGIETKSDIFPMDVFKWHWNISMTFITGTIQSRNQVKWNKITPDMCKSDSIFPDLQGSALFKWLLKLFLDKVYLRNEW